MSRRHRSLEWWCLAPTTSSLKIETIRYLAATTQHAPWRGWTYTLRNKVSYPPDRGFLGEGGTRQVLSN